MKKKKIFTFADTPHSLKLLRNHYLESGLIYKAEIVTNKTIVDLLNHTSSSDVSIAHKVTIEHWTVNGPGFFNFTIK